jgi:hypothetical protein
MIKINVEGKEIAKSVVDLFSPLTEMAGVIGDHIRIYRELTVLRTLKRAKRIAEEEGLALEPPPLKFLIPFLENSSLEEESDEVLNKLWTNLLVSSASQYKSEHNLFIRILNELSPKDAMAFRYIAESGKHKAYESLDEASVAWSPSYVYIGIREQLKKYEEKNYKDINFSEFKQKLKEQYQPPGSLIYHFSVATGKKDEYPYTGVYEGERSEFDDLFDDTSFSTTKSLGLIGEFRSPEYWFDDLMFELSSYYLTPLGASFYLSCINRHG